MKNLLFCLLVGSLYTAKSQAAVDFKAALKLYEDKKYQKAFNAFLILSDADYTNVDYNYYLARSAFFIKQYNEAISAYERILIMYPHNARSKLELGRLYYKLQRYTEARSYLNEVLNSNAPKPVKNNIRYYLARMEENGKKPKHNTFNGTLLGSIFYDSNLNYSPVTDQVTLPSGKLNASADIGAWGSEQMLIINHRYDNPDKYPFAWKNDFTLYNKASPGNSDFNILYGGYSPALSFQKNRWAFDSALSLDAMNYGKNPYLVSYGIAPKTTYMPNLTEYFSAQLKLLKRQYQTSETRPKNSKFGQMMLAYQKRVGPVFSWYGQGTLESETKDTQPSSSYLGNVDYNLWGVKAGANYLLPKNFSVSGSLGYQSKQFTQDSRLMSGFGVKHKKQHDNRYYAEVMVAKELSKNFSAQLRASRAQNDSNIDIYTYQNNLFTFNVLKRF